MGTRQRDEKPVNGRTQAGWPHLVHVSVRAAADPLQELVLVLRVPPGDVGGQHHRRVGPRHPRGGRGRRRRRAQGAAAATRRRSHDLRRVEAAAVVASPSRVCRERRRPEGASPHLTA